jgi:hypothetical protein
MTRQTQKIKAIEHSISDSLVPVTVAEMSQESNRVDFSSLELKLHDDLTYAVRTATTIFEQIEVGTGKGEALMIFAVNASVTNGLTSLPYSLDVYKTLQKKEKNILLDAIFFQVFNIEKRNTSSQIAQNFKKVIEAICYLSIKGIEVALSNSKELLLPAYLTCKESLGGDLKAAPSLVHLKNTAKTFFKGMTESEEEEGVNSVPKNSNTIEEESDKISLEVNEEGEVINLEAFPTLLSLVGETVEHLTIEQASMIEDELLALSLQINTKLASLRLSVSDAA